LTRVKALPREPRHDEDGSGKTASFRGPTTREEKLVNKMLVAVFNTEGAAHEGLSALKDLDRRADITLYATAVIAKDASGRIDMKQAADRGPVGIALGALAGGLVGALAGPVGVVAGTSFGATAGAWADLGEAGIDAAFVSDVSDALTPGKVAVLAEIQETWETPVNARLRPLGAVVLRRLRSEVVEDQLAREAAALRAERQLLQEDLAQASAQADAAMQAQIEAVDRQLEAIEQQAEARADRAKREFDAKVTTMRERMKQVNDREKAKIEKRMAEAKADYAVRSGKLEQAGKLVREAIAAR
jgi:uncharacterized membrane protein